jgi:hypothetical protein
VTGGSDIVSPQGCHSGNLIDNITNNLTDNNPGNQEEEEFFIYSQEDLLLDLTKEEIKNLDIDKDKYLWIVKQRKYLGIFD